MSDEIPVHYCRRLQSLVIAEPINDVSGGVFVGCKYYSGWDFGMNKYPCFKHLPNNKRCLVKLAVIKEESKLIS